MTGPAQGPSALFLGMCQGAIKQENVCSFIARCTIVLYILPLNYYVLSAAELSSQILRWFKAERFNFPQWTALDLHNFMV